MSGTGPPQGANRAPSGGVGVHVLWLGGPEVARLALTDEEILAAVEGALAAQGRGETVIEPRVHLVPESSAKGHFNVLRGYVRPLGVAGVKVVGDFVGNYKLGLPSEMALLNLFSPETGMPLGRWKKQARFFSALRRLAAGASVKQVAAESGYRSASAFVAAFRKTFETTPGKYFSPRATS